jgi:3-isopropylmalate/(R)-2-methylmalate dehydratase small subunit
MEPMTHVSGVAATLMIDNIDTDQIIPGKDLMKVEKSGFGEVLFGNWRYREDGSEEPGFVLNRAPFREARFLVAGDNFGCGSSRASAAWAVRDFGIRCVIASSFGSIFQANCYASGILPVALGEEEVRTIAAGIEGGGHNLSLDLERCELRAGEDTIFSFKVPRLEKEMLLSGKDPIGVTLLRDASIDRFQNLDRIKRPWVYDVREREVVE